MDFRTRRKDGIVFPLGSGKKYHRQDDYVKSPMMQHIEPDTEDEDENYDMLLEEEQEQMRQEEAKKEKQKAQQMRKLQNPSFTSTISAKSDVKKLMHANDSKVNKQKEFNTYKKRLDRDLTEVYIREDKKSDNRREKALQKSERMEAKAKKLQQKSQQIKGEYK